MFEINIAFLQVVCNHNVYKTSCAQLFCCRASQTITSCLSLTSVFWVSPIYPGHFLFPFSQQASQTTPLQLISQWISHPTQYWQQFRQLPWIIAPLVSSRNIQRHIWETNKRNLLNFDNIFRNKSIIEQIEQNHF